MTLPSRSPGPRVGSLNEKVLLENYLRQPVLLSHSCRSWLVESFFSPRCALLKQRKLSPGQSGQWYQLGTVSAILKKLISQYNASLNNHCPFLIIELEGAAWHRLSTVQSSLTPPSRLHGPQTVPSDVWATIGISWTCKYWENFEEEE